MFRYKLGTVTSPQHPQRRLPEEIYRRRRIAGFAILLLLVLILVWFLSAVFGGNGDENPQSAADSSAANQTATATATAARDDKDGKASATKDDADDADDAANDSAAQEADDIDGAGEAKDADRPKKDKDKNSADERPSPYAEADEAHAAANACDLHNLRVTANSNKAYYGPGDQPSFYMSIENPTEHDCTVNLDENPLRFEVYDLNTNHRMWADTDCYPAVITGEQEFKAGQTRHFEAVWSRTNSAPGECNHRPATPAGNYFLHAVVGDNASDALTFALRA